MKSYKSIGKTEQGQNVQTAIQLFRQTGKETTVKVLKMNLATAAGFGAAAASKILTMSTESEVYSETIC